MKRLLVCAALAIAVYSCGNSGNTGGQSTEDTTSPASGATGTGLDGTGTSIMGTGEDTTGLNVGAAQPVDSSTNSRRVYNEPGADKSGVKYKTNNTGGTGGGNGQ